MLPLFLLVLVTITEVHSQGCSGGWEVATMSGYDNLDGADDQHPGCVAEYCGTNENFLRNVPVVSIHIRNWRQYKYHNISVQVNGQTHTVQSWDQCADADCDDDDPNCCTRNAALYAPPGQPGFLLDVERRTLQRFWGLNYENTLLRVNYMICEQFDPKPIARQYGLHQ